MWLAATALGALACRPSRGLRPDLLSIPLFLFAVLLPLAVAFARGNRVLFGGVPGAYLPFGEFYKLVFPAPLSVIYDFHVAREASDPRVIAGAAIVLVFCAAMFLARKRPSVLAGLSMMAVPLLPVLYVPALSSSARADRYLYLPSAGLAIVLASLASRLDKKAA